MKPIIIDQEGSWRPRTLNQVLGYNIMKARHSTILRGDQVAEKLGISQSAYSRIETGTSEITFNDIASIAIALGCTIESIIDEPIKLVQKPPEIKKPKKKTKRKGRR